MGKKTGQENEGASNWGKGKTDPDSWFKPGCKGGPGRPKGSQNRRSVWLKINAEKKTVSVEGKSTKIATGELKYIQVANRAAAGDMKAINKAIELDDRFLPVEPAAPTSQDTDADLRALDVLIALRQKFAKPGSGS